MWMYIGHLCRWLIVTYCRPVGGCWHLHRHHCPAPLHHLILIHEGSTPHHISEGNGNHTQLLSPCGFLLFVNFCATLYLFNAFTDLCRLQRIMCPWFDFSCQHCMYLLVYIICFPTYPFSSLFPYLLPYLSFPLRIDPLRFLARCHKRRLNWTSVHFFWLVNACFCYVRFSFFSIPSQVHLIHKIHIPVTSQVSGPAWSNSGKEAGLKLSACVCTAQDSEALWLCIVHIQWHWLHRCAKFSKCLI